MAEQPGFPPADNALIGALSRWENEGGRAAGYWKPRVASVNENEQLSQSSSAYRLIKAPPVDRDRAATAFEAIATVIQHRDKCDRVTALQRTVDEHPSVYTQYCEAMAGKL